MIVCSLVHSSVEHVPDDQWKWSNGLGIRISRVTWTWGNINMGEHNIIIDLGELRVVLAEHRLGGTLT